MQDSVEDEEDDDHDDEGDVVERKHHIKSQAVPCFPPM